MMIKLNYLLLYINIIMAIKHARLLSILVKMVRMKIVVEIITYLNN